MGQMHQSQLRILSLLVIITCVGSLAHLMMSLDENGKTFFLWRVVTCSWSVVVGRLSRSTLFPQVLTAGVPPHHRSTSCISPPPRRPASRHRPEGSHQQVNPRWRLVGLPGEWLGRSRSPGSWGGKRMGEGVREGRERQGRGKGEGVREGREGWSWTQATVHDSQPRVAPCLLVVHFWQ